MAGYAVRNYGQRASSSEDDDDDDAGALTQSRQLQRLTQQQPQQRGGQRTNYDFHEAMSALSAMFPSLGVHSIHEVMYANNGDVHSTIDQLIDLSLPPPPSLSALPSTDSAYPDNPPNQPAASAYPDIGAMQCGASADSACLNNSPTQRAEEGNLDTSLPANRTQRPQGRQSVRRGDPQYSLPPSSRLLNSRHIHTSPPPPLSALPSTDSAYPDIPPTQRTVTVIGEDSLNLSLEAIQKQIFEKFPEIDERAFGYLASSKNTCEYDYGDSVKELGDFCLEISHEGFSRRQLYIIFSAFGKIKAILSHGYVKVFFHRYEDAVSAFSTLKDSMIGLGVSSEMRRWIRRNDSRRRIPPVSTSQPREAETSRGNEDSPCTDSFVTTETSLNPIVVKRKVRRMREATDQRVGVQREATAQRVEVQREATVFDSENPGNFSDDVKLAADHSSARLLPPPPPTPPPPPPPPPPQDSSSHSERSFRRSCFV